MKRNRAAVVTTVSTVMLGAGWVAGLVGTAFASTNGATTIEAIGTGGAAATTAVPSTTAPSTTTTSSASPSASAAATDSTTATTTTPAPVETTPAAVSGTFDGASVKTRYGSYQAEITVEAGTITNIAMLQSGASDGESRQISGYALPQLISAVLQQQTFNVSYVSGASYTSQGFAVSVQDAMTQAGLA